ncbi:MAG: NTP transferase domain-containing protein [Tissierellales bacterium]|nr:NTP transferase domain-containing protein [Tissierellales bacterium]
MKNKKIGAVIVAGGMSSRMRDFKPLLPIGSKSMIETTVENYKQLGVEEIVVVTGYRSEDIEESLKEKNLNFIKNKHYNKTHMYDSVCLGLKELSEDTDYTFISPADSPFVQQFTLKKMVDEINISNHELIQPVYEGKDGHPIILKKEFFKIILEHDGTMGMQGVIKNNNKKCGKLSFVDQGIVMDADRPNDYFKILEYNEIKNCPTVEICEKIQKYFKIEDKVVLHSQKVTTVALDICEKLKKKGFKLNVNLLIAGGLLHDIGKGKVNHAKVGSKWLKSMGYEKLSDIVSEHMELKKIPKIPTEKEIIFLSDKLVKEDEIVTINERFENKKYLYEDNKKVLKIIERRKKQAKEVYKLIFNNYELDDYKNK